MRSTLKHQAGASMFSILIVLIVAGFLFSVAFKLMPAYMDHRTISSVLVDAMNDPDELAKGARGIRIGMSKKLIINQVKMPSDGLRITEEEGIITATLDYEVRVPMFVNVDAIVSFNEEYEAEAP
ncbi:DUF4845 domain-containing protein [Neptuniibacter sp. PT8_73]|uniref:DUF4845 domain-containing protein n=1 Tax=unclassified Neptuniibacter TaxID=2630693 RepID=UPI0039F67B06